MPPKVRGILLIKGPKFDGWEKEEISVEFLWGTVLKIDHLKERESVWENNIKINLKQRHARI
jgi:hypothetical protein